MDTLLFPVGLRFQAAGGNVQLISASGLGLSGDTLEVTGMAGTSKLKLNASSGLIYTAPVSGSPETGYVGAVLPPQGGIAVSRGVGVARSAAGVSTLGGGAGN